VSLRFSSPPADHKSAVSRGTAPHPTDSGSHPLGIVRRMPTKWEYLTIELQATRNWSVRIASLKRPDLSTKTTVADALQVCGEEGWELVTRVGGEYIFKRPLE
jgi:hypothetical protein